MRRSAASTTSCRRGPDRIDDSDPLAHLAHIPAKWTPVRRQEYAPNNEARARSDSVRTERALVCVFVHDPSEESANFPGSRPRRVKASGMITET